MTAECAGPSSEMTVTTAAKHMVLVVGLLGSNSNLTILALCPQESDLYFLDFLICKMGMMITYCPHWVSGRVE